MRSRVVMIRIMCAVATLTIAPCVSMASSGCPEDFDGSGDVGLPDLLTLLSEFGTAGASDLDGDGLVTLSDLLRVLSRFGGQCEDLCDLFSPQVPLAQVDGQLWPADGVVATAQNAGFAVLDSSPGAADPVFLSEGSDRYIWFPPTAAGVTRAFSLVDPGAFTGAAYHGRFELMFERAGAVPLPSGATDAMVGVGGAGAGLDPVVLGDRLQLVATVTQTRPEGVNLRWSPNVPDGADDQSGFSPGLSMCTDFLVPFDTRVTLDYIVDRPRKFVAVYINGILWCEFNQSDIDRLDSIADALTIRVPSRPSYGLRVYAGGASPIESFGCPALISTPDRDGAMEDVSLHLASASRWDVVTQATSLVARYGSGGVRPDRGRFRFVGTAGNFASVSLPAGSVRVPQLGSHGGYFMTFMGLRMTPGASASIFVADGSGGALLALDFEPSGAIRVNGEALPINYPTSARFQVTINFTPDDTHVIISNLSVTTFTPTAPTIRGASLSQPVGVPPSIGRVRADLSMTSSFSTQEIEFDGLYTISEETVLLASSYVQAMAFGVTPGLSTANRVAPSIFRIGSGVLLDGDYGFHGTNPAGRSGRKLTDWYAVNQGVFEHLAGARLVLAEWMVNDLSQSNGDPVALADAVDEVQTALAALVAEADAAGVETYIAAQAVFPPGGGMGFDEDTRAAVRSLNAVARGLASGRPDVHVIETYAHGGADVDDYNAALSSWFDPAADDIHMTSQGDSVYREILQAAIRALNGG